MLIWGQQFALGQYLALEQSGYEGGLLLMMISVVIEEKKGP